MVVAVEPRDGIAERVGDINARVMKGYDASRVELFTTIDKPALKSLPGEPYAFAVWKRCRVAPDYQPMGQTVDSPVSRPFEARIPTTREGATLKAGALLTREWNGKLERVMVLERGFAWNGETYGSLSQIAKAMTGTNWNGHRFFGLRMAKSAPSARGGTPRAKQRRQRSAGCRFYWSYPRQHSPSSPRLAPRPPSSQQDRCRSCRGTPS